MVEAPNILVGKINIPQNKDDSHCNDGSEIRFPMLNKMHSFFLKTEKKRNDKTEYI